MPTADDFNAEILRRFSQAQLRMEAHVDVVSGEVHRRLGGYPSHSHRMPVLCDVMFSLMKNGDIILHRPNKGKGATLHIRYKLPR